MSESGMGLYNSMIVASQWGRIEDVKIESNAVIMYVQLELNNLAIS